jgi:hypothetical protein
MFKFTAEKGNRLITHLQETVTLDHGAVIPLSVVYDHLGIDFPDDDTPWREAKEFVKEFTLYELSIMDYVRRSLLKEGKYLKKDTTCYRILLPSENVHQVDNMLESASRKLRKALTLNKNTPKESGEIDCNTPARIAAKMESIESAKKQADLLK